jgi:hypothetical protein
VGAVNPQIHGFHSRSRPCSMPRGDEGCSMQTVQSAQERPEKNRTDAPEKPALGIQAGTSWS